MSLPTKIMPAILCVYVLSDHAIFSRKFTPGPRGDKIACKRELFFDHDWAGYLTYPGSPTSMYTGP